VSRCFKARFQALSDKATGWIAWFTFFDGGVLGTSRSVDDYTCWAHLSTTRCVFDVPFSINTLPDLQCAVASYQASLVENNGGTHIIETCCGTTETSAVYLCWGSDAHDLPVGTVFEVFKPRFYALQRCLEVEVSTDAREMNIPERSPCLLPLPALPCCLSGLLAKSHSNPINTKNEMRKQILGTVTYEVVEFTPMSFTVCFL